MSAGCVYFPSAGPSRSNIESEYQRDASSHPFELVDVSDHAIQVLLRRPGTSLASLFGSAAAPPALPVGPGDSLSVSIWESGSQPLFNAGISSSQLATGSAASHGAVLPEQTVGSDGCISIPFAGRVPVAGHSITEIQDAIAAALAGKAAKPQVLVSLAHNVSNTVTVVGEVTVGGRVALSEHGDRLLDVIAAAGGVRAPSYETWIGLMRGNASSSVPLQQVLANPGENLFPRPGDVITVTRQPQTFTVFGATGKNAQLSFDAVHINLVEALAKAGGLLDQRADPRGVFLFRREPQGVATALAGRTLGGPISAAGVAGAAVVPVVYRLDLTRASSYFLASSFDIRNGDVLFVSGAPVNELDKFLQLLGLAAGPAIDAALLNNSL